MTINLRAIAQNPNPTQFGYVGASGALAFKDQADTPGVFTIIGEFRSTSKVLQAANKTLDTLARPYSERDAKEIHLRLSRQLIVVERDLLETWNQGILGKIRYIFAVCILAVVGFQRSAENAYQDFSSKMVAKTPSINFYKTLFFDLVDRADLGLQAQWSNAAPMSVVEAVLNQAVKLVPSQHRKAILSAAKEDLNDYVSLPYPLPLHILFESYFKELKKVAHKTQNRIINESGEIDPKMKPLFDEMYKIAKTRAEVLFEQFPKQYQEHERVSRQDNQNPVSKARLLQDQNGLVQKYRLFGEASSLANSYRILRTVGKVQNLRSGFSRNQNYQWTAHLVDLFYQRGHALNRYREEYNDFCNKVCLLVGPTVAAGRNNLENNGYRGCDNRVFRFTREDSRKEEFNEILRKKDF